MASFNDNSNSYGSEGGSESKKNFELAGRYVGDSLEEENSPLKQYLGQVDTKYGTATKDEEVNEEGYEALKYQGMRSPISMRKGVTPDKERLVPEMQRQSPFPGRLVVTSTTDPIETVTWGPNIITDPSGGRQGSRPTSVRQRLLKQPPSSPSETTSIHSLSTPTLPELHRASDPILVEQFITERAQDAAAFDAKTKSIKDGLVIAKLNRGGSKRLLTNEYTVELASRLDAEKSEKLAGLVRLPLQEQHETGDHGLEISEKQLSLSEPSNEGTVKATGSDRFKGKFKGKKLRIPQELEASDDVRKITTSGTIRSQKSQRSETGDHGEKKVVKTWIEITEVYEVPKNTALAWEDISEVVKAQDDGSLRATRRVHKLKKPKGDHAFSKKGKWRRLADADEDSSGVASDVEDHPTAKHPSRGVRSLDEDNTSSSSKYSDSEPTLNTKPGSKTSKFPGLDQAALKSINESLLSIVTKLEDLEPEGGTTIHLKARVNSIIERLNSGASNSE